jgi:hypothetical protein
MPVYAWLSFINYAIKLRLTYSWSTLLESNHAALLNFKYTNNEQSRLLQFYIPEAIHQVFGATIEHSYAVARLLFVFMTFVFFHRYLRNWFSAAAAFAGVVLLAAIMPFSHVDDLQESSPLLGLLFLLGLWAIRDNHIPLMVFSFLAGGLTNETMMILPSVYFFYHLKFGTWRGFVAPAARACLAGLPLIVTLGPIRYYNRHCPHLGGGFHWPDNLRGIMGELSVNPLDMAFTSYLWFIIFFGIAWYYMLLGYWESPLFLRRASWMIPFFILAHLITGKINEPRQMIPLAFIVIPMAMVYICGYVKRTSTSVEMMSASAAPLEDVPGVAQASPFADP